MLAQNFNRRTNAAMEHNGWVLAKWLIPKAELKK